MRWLPLLLLFALTTGQARAFDHDLQFWSSFLFQGPTDSSSQLYFEVSPRFASNLTRMQTLLVRPAYVHHFDQHHSAWLGLGWTPLLDPSFRDEVRLWQQYLLKEEWGAHGVSLRLRLEERFVEGFATAFRLRIMGRLTHPFWTTPWEAVVWDELFLNLNSIAGLGDAGFDRNRLFVGVSYELHASMKLESGYMLQIVSRPNVDLMTHNLCLFSSVRF